MDYRSKTASFLDVVKMNKPIIIAICGKSATGKDTLAK